MMASILALVVLLLTYMHSFGHTLPKVPDIIQGFGNLRSMRPQYRPLLAAGWQRVVWRL